MPNDPKPPRGPIEDCLQSLTNIVANMPRSGLGLVELTEKATAMARAELDSLRADAEAYRFLCKQNSKALRHLERDIETGRRKPNELRKE